MRRPRMMGRILYVAMAGLFASPAPAPAQLADPTPAASRTAGPSASELDLLRRLAADPVTGPYEFGTSVSNGRVRLQGRVGTKLVHDTAVRIAIDTGIPFDDSLVIDTAATLRAAGGPPQAYGGRGYAPGSLAGMPGGTPGYSRPGNVPYVYPQPLFGYYDDPFYGFEPPTTSYPPYWGALRGSRLDPAYLAALAAQQGQQAKGPRTTTRTIRIPPASGRELGRVELDIDPQGDGIVRGVVPSESDRAEVEAKLRDLPELRSLRNEVEVRSPDQPPPPPTPAALPDRPAPRGPMIGPPIVRPAPARAEPPRAAIDPTGGSDARLEKAIRRRPGLAGLPIRASFLNGVATLSGKVPGVLEAMLAYRAVQQTPGVREIDDRLEFAVPPNGEKNPLLARGRPEDVEPYLEAQIRRQLGDKAHVDRVKIRGDQLDIRGTLAAGNDPEQVEATLRVMPVLRGFRTSSQFLPE